MAALDLNRHTAPSHVTVLRDEVVATLDLADGDVVIDATAGFGGHVCAVMEKSEGVSVLAFDRDARAVEATRTRVRHFGERVTVTCCRFSEIRAHLDTRGITRVAGLVADLGVSSPQLDEAERGMSFRREGPLDMRMDRGRGETALELVERLAQDDLANVIYRYGEERRSRRVAACIKQALAAGELATTLDLRRAVVKAVGPRRIGGIDPATRTFQALRIAVNDELAEIESLLELASERLCPDGVAAFISFHSLEDRIVKRTFQQRALWRRLSSKPVLPSEVEQTENPRSRSAKLRAARRTELLEVPPDLPEGVDPWSVGGRS